MIRNHPHLTIIIWILISSGAAYIVTAIFIGSEYRGYLIGNPIFLLILTMLVAGTGVPAQLEGKGLLAIAFALLIFAIMAFLGLLIVDTLPTLAKVLAGPLISIGAYPSGPDVWFPAGAAVWFASSFVLSAASCFTGTLLGRLFQHRKIH